MSEADAVPQRRFVRLHLWLLVAPCLAAGSIASILVLDANLLWAVPAGPFGGLLHRGGFTGWSRGLGAWVLSLLPWASAGLFVAAASQWLLPRRLATARLVFWTVGWLTWSWCGLLSCLNTYG